MYTRNIQFFEKVKNKKIRWSGWDDYERYFIPVELISDNEMRGFYYNGHEISTTTAGFDFIHGGSWELCSKMICTECGRATEVEYRLTALNCNDVLCESCWKNQFTSPCPTNELKCECGAEKCGFNSHSEWCLKAKKENK